LQQALFETKAEFFAEDVIYKEIGEKKVRSNIIKMYLHAILTNAIFHYAPCKDLLDVFDENQKPKSDVWATNENKWLHLSAEPFQIVSAISLELFNIAFHSSHFIFPTGTSYRTRPNSTVSPTFCKS